MYLTKKWKEAGSMTAKTQRKLEFPSRFWNLGKNVKYLKSCQVQNTLKNK